MRARARTDATNPDYPDWDERTNAMPDQNRRVMEATIQTLQVFFACDPMVYVSGNTPVFFSYNGRRGSVIPDVFLVRNVPKRMRRGYRIWEEGKAPDVVLELTSRSSLHEDTQRRFTLYQNALAVQEYFLFDPLGHSLEPRLQGYRLSKGRYRPIKEANGRVPSKMLGVHLEAHGEGLGLYDPRKERLLPTPDETPRWAEAEIECLRRELEALRQHAPEEK
jgi:Uma2 family endonuclease